MRDLTVGKPGRVLIGYTLPLFGSIIFQQLYNIADSFVAGRYIGPLALGAVGNSYEITLIYIALAFGCNVGTSVITARLFGQKAYGELCSAVYTALIFAAGLGLALTAAGTLLVRPMLDMMRTKPELMQDSADYLRIYLWGYVFLILYQVATGIFSALGDSKTPFIFLAISSVVNIFVDIWFVRDLNMGVKGVAYATFLCQSISSILALAVVLAKMRKLQTERVALFSRRWLGKILRIAVPSAVQQGCISIGNILIQGVINDFGPAATSGYAAAVKLNNMTITSATALGNGISNFTSQNLGVRKYERIRRGTWNGILLGVGIVAAFTLVYQLLCNQLLGLFITEGASKDPELVDAAMAVGGNFIRIITPFYAVIAVKLAVDGALRGAGLMRPFMIATMTDLFLRVLLCYVLAPGFGIEGVWSAWPIGWLVGTGMSCWLYIRWQKNLQNAPDTNDHD